LDDVDSSVREYPPYFWFGPSQWSSHTDQVKLVLLLTFFLKNFGPFCWTMSTLQTVSIHLIFCLVLLTLTKPLSSFLPSPSCSFLIRQCLHVCACRLWVATMFNSFESSKITFCIWDFWSHPLNALICSVQGKILILSFQRKPSIYLQVYFCLTPCCRTSALF
jgi:hypothetical protein